MARPVSLSPEKTTIKLESGLRKHLEQHAKDEGRTLERLRNNSQREYVLAIAALYQQPQLFRGNV